MASELTEKQKAFCREYAKDLNATQAAIRAGYSEDSAQQIGSENLSKPVIQAEIKKRIKRASDKADATVERVLLELVRIAFSDVRSVMSWDKHAATLRDSDELTDDEAAAVQSVKAKYSKDGEFEPEIKLADKQKALELLGRYLGMWDKNRPDADTVIQIVRGIGGASRADDS